MNQSVMRSAVLSMFVITAAPVEAQDASKIRSLLGGPTDLREAALFAASRASYKTLCKTDPPEEGKLSIINRLNYGSLVASEQQAFDAIVAGQFKSNETVYSIMPAGSVEEFCNGLRRSIVSYAASFIREHPNVFSVPEKASDDQPQVEAKTFLDELEHQLSDLNEFQRFYVIRVIENRIGDDMRKLSSDHKNRDDGYVWAFKNFSVEFAILAELARTKFPEIQKIYEERSNLYSQYVRGELRGEAFVRAERSNEADRIAIYDRLLEGYMSSGKVDSSFAPAAFDRRAAGIARTIAGHARIVATN